MAEKDNKREFKRGDFIKTSSNDVYIFWQRMSGDSCLLLGSNGKLVYSEDFPPSRANFEERTSFLIKLRSVGIVWNSEKRIPRITPETLTPDLVGVELKVYILAMRGDYQVEVSKIKQKNEGYYYLENGIIIPYNSIVDDTDLVSDEKGRIKPVFSPDEQITNGKIVVTVRFIRDYYYHTDEGILISILGQGSWKSNQKFKVGDKVLIPASITGSHPDSYAISLPADFTDKALLVKKSAADKYLTTAKELESVK